MPVTDDHRPEWLRQRVMKALEPVRDGAIPEAVIARVDGLLATAEQQQREQDEAYRGFLIELLKRLAAGRGGDAAAVLELLAAALDSNVSAAELRQIQSLVPSEQEAPAGPPQAGAGGDGDLGSSEQRANAAFKDHLDSRTREFEALRARLCADASETMRANEEAGRLLDSLITRLQLGTTVPEVLDTRLEMAEEIQRVSAAHETVARKLEGTFESLQSLTVDNERLQEELQRVRVLSLTDESTDLPNRRAFLRQLKAESARARREGGRFSVAILDLDHFKTINDRNGHGAGDAVLRTYARHVLSAFRAHDLVARYGGEEFGILLPSTPAADACKAVAKIRDVAVSMSVEWEGDTIDLPTFSAGVAEFHGGEAPEALINRADRALYRAKSNGRDRIEVEDEPGAEGARAPRLLHDTPPDGRERGVSG